MILNVIEAGEGKPVVLLHGLFGQARNFGAIQRALADRFRVVTLDMRNHGDSPHGTDMRYPTQAEDVQETLAARGIESAAVIGHSMGGKAAMAMALRWPEAVGRLMVSDIAPVPYQHGNTVYRRGDAGDPAVSGPDPASGGCGVGGFGAGCDAAAVPAAESTVRGTAGVADWVGGDRGGDPGSGGMG